MQAVERQTLEAQLVEAFNQTLTDVYPEAHLEVKHLLFDEVADLLRLTVSIGSVSHIPTLTIETSGYVAGGILRLLSDDFNHLTKHEREFSPTEALYRPYMGDEGSLIMFAYIPYKDRSTATKVA